MANLLKQGHKDLLRLRIGDWRNDIATSEDYIAHIEALEEYKRGETLTDKDINWD